MYRDIGELENLDEKVTARVVFGAIAGLYTIMESVVMFNSVGQMWVAYIDDQTVRYFTNVPAYRNFLPKTIENWRRAFSDKPVEYCDYAPAFSKHSF